MKRQRLSRTSQAPSRKKPKLVPVLQRCLIELVLSNCKECAQSVAASAPNIDLCGSNTIFGHFDVNLEAFRCVGAFDTSSAATMAEMCRRAVHNLKRSRTWQEAYNPALILEYVMRAWPDAVAHTWPVVSSENGKIRFPLAELMSELATEVSAQETKYWTASTEECMHGRSIALRYVMSSLRRCKAEAMAKAKGADACRHKDTLLRWCVEALQSPSVPGKSSSDPLASAVAYLQSLDNPSCKAQPPSPKRAQYWSHLIHSLSPLAAVMASLRSCSAAAATMDACARARLGFDQPCPPCTLLPGERSARTPGPDSEDEAQHSPSPPEPRGDGMRMTAAIFGDSSSDEGGAGADNTRESTRWSDDIADRKETKPASESGSAVDDSSEYVDGGSSESEVQFSDSPSPRIRKRGVQKENFQTFVDLTESTSDTDTDTNAKAADVSSSTVGVSPLRDSTNSSKKHTKHIPGEADDDSARGMHVGRGSSDSDEEEVQFVDDSLSDSPSPPRSKHDMQRAKRQTFLDSSESTNGTDTNTNAKAPMAVDMSSNAVITPSRWIYQFCVLL